MDNESFLRLIENNNESEVIEFKSNMNVADQIGEYISALGNSAKILELKRAYMVWGVEDETKKIIGTKFDPYKTKINEKSNKPLITEIEDGLSPKVILNWGKLTIDNEKITLLEIDISYISFPISYKGVRYIRVGTSKKKLSACPEKERSLWRSFETSKFELRFVATGKSFSDVKKLLNIDYYISKKKNLSRESNDKEIIQSLIHDNVIKLEDGKISITNLGAYALARNMEKFPRLERKTPRITRYQGIDRTDNATFDRKGFMGVGTGFDNIIKVIMAHLPYNEDYSNGSRKDEYIVPQLAIREVVANAIVHQDFTQEGSRPLISIFDDRVEISNPGIPLIDKLRILDYDPISRNEELAGLLEEMNIVESRGTGIDKVVKLLEEKHLPALDISLKGNNSTVITLRAKIPFSEMDIEEKINSIYWHACLKYASSEQKISNKTIRETFNLSSNQTTSVSKVVSKAISKGVIKKYDNNAGRKQMKYVPFWGNSIN